MKQVQVRRIDQTGDGVTVRYLPDNQAALTGPLVPLERKIQLELALGNILAGPDELVETGYGRRITAIVRLRPPVAAPRSWWERPGLILTWVGSGCAVVLSVGAAVSWVVGAIASLWPLLVGVAAVLVGGAIALKVVGGRGGSSGTWKTN